MSCKQHKSKDKKSNLTNQGDNLSNKKDGGDEIDQEDTDDFVTTKYVFEMLKVQESFFRNLFDPQLLANVNIRIDGVIKDLTELKSSLQFPQKDIEDLKPLAKQMTKIEKEIGEAQIQVDYHCDKIEYLENQSTGTIFVLMEYLRNLMKHGKTLNVKLKRHWNLNSISLSKCKLSMHIICVKIIVGKLMPATLALSVPALLFVDW